MSDQHKTELDELTARVGDIEAAVANMATALADMTRHVAQQRIALIQALGAAEDCLGIDHEVSALAKRRQKVGKI